jgi:hypothetical protein
MSEPDNPRWLTDVGEELRQEVPVRAAWRARLLDEVASLPRPTAGDEPDAGSTAGLAHHRQQRWRISVGPFAGIAAALLFAALGAGATFVALSGRGQARESSTVAITPSRSTAGGSRGVPTRGGPTADQEVVRFELAAPQAAHVALVGSFNEWNPVATPLLRDPSSGKWIVSLRLPPGRHVYAFVVDGDVTADPTAPRAADADFGSANSVLLVSGKAS